MANCQYLFYQGYLGDKWPSVSKEVGTFKKVSIYSIPKDSGFRLQKIVACLQKIKKRERSLAVSKSFFDDEIAVVEEADEVDEDEEEEEHEEGSTKLFAQTSVTCISICFVVMIGLLVMVGFIVRKGVTFAAIQFERIATSTDEESVFWQI